MNTHESRLKRMSGMSSNKKAYLKQKLAMADNWRINCPTCNKRITGLLSEVKEHSETCNDEKSN